jgi:hypothetical protein
MADSIHFLIFIIVSLIAFVFILRFVLRERSNSLPILRISLISLIVVVGGMIFAKHGATSGFPIWIYYGVPALLTLLLPPIFFRMTSKEILLYLLLAFLVSPLIHLLFSFFVGWKEYMPFIQIPSLWELLK